MYEVPLKIFARFTFHVSGRTHVKVRDEVTVAPKISFQNPNDDSDRILLYFDAIFLRNVLCYFVIKSSTAPRT
ncbi:MAG: hypothetical protein JKY60_13515 [Kordiimonadaceae bacterium]|nr:hypothetical protein [Kordiimonadaceae bacterium]